MKGDDPGEACSNGPAPSRSRMLPVRACNFKPWHPYRPRRRACGLSPPCPHRSRRAVHRLGGFHTLAVQHRRRRAGLPTSALAHDQMMVDPKPRRRGSARTHDRAWIAAESCPATSSRHSPNAAYIRPRSQSDASSTCARAGRAAATPGSSIRYQSGHIHTLARVAMLCAGGPDPHEVFRKDFEHRPRITSRSAIRPLTASVSPRFRNGLSDLP